MIRGYTTLDQGQTLMNLGISPDTADFALVTDLGGEHLTGKSYKQIHEEFDVLREKFGELESKEFPCWSLTALLEIMGKDCEITLQKERVVNTVYYFSYGCHSTEDYDSPIDAAMEMICWLITNGNVTFKRTEPEN